MNSRNDLIYFRHILDAIARIETYIAGISEPEFYQRELVQDGVIRQLLIIGEAVRNVTSSFKKQHRNIPWKDIAGMRNKLVHDYLGVNLKAVWLTATNDLTLLKTQIMEIMYD